MYKDLKTLAIIPARSGSKGLVDKNIKNLAGKPLIAWSIETALNSNIFDEVIVSTDSQKYADIAKKYGASVPFLRSKENSSDNASSWSVVKEVVDNVDKKFDVIVLLQPTSPLREAKDIKASIDLFIKKDADYVLSVCKCPHPVQWTNIIGKDLSLDNFIKKEYLDKRRQDLEQNYILNGAIYILRAELLSEKINMFTNKSFAYIMSEANSIDIDTDLDFRMAEIFMNSKNEEMNK